MAYRGSNIPLVGYESPDPYPEIERLEINTFNSLSGPGFNQMQSVLAQEHHLNRPYMDRSAFDSPPVGTPTPIPLTLDGQTRLGTNPFSSTPYEHVRARNPQVVPLVSPRTQSASINRLLDQRVEALPQGPQRLSDITRNSETVASASEMPLGSYVHLREPPQWGVIKISNVSCRCFSVRCTSLTTA